MQPLDKDCSYCHVEKAFYKKRFYSNVVVFVVDKGWMPQTKWRYVCNSDLCWEKLQGETREEYAEK
jgi:hypothetical protein